MEHNRGNNVVIGNRQVNKATTDTTKGNLLGSVGISRQAPSAASQPKGMWIVREWDNSTGRRKIEDGRC